MLLRDRARACTGTADGIHDTYARLLLCTTQNQFRAVQGTERSEASMSTKEARKNRSKGFVALSRIEIHVPDSLPAYAGPGAYSSSPACDEVSAAFLGVEREDAAVWSWAWRKHDAAESAHILQRPEPRRGVRPWIVHQCLANRKTNNDRDVQAYLSRVYSENEDVEAVLDEGDHVSIPITCQAQ